MSAFSGKGQNSAFKLAKRHMIFRELFQLLGTEWDLSDELFTRLQEFTCFMYNSNPGTKDVNDLRYRLFCAKKGDLDSNQQPPSVDTLRKHCDRANYIVAIWRRSLQSCPQIPSPVGHGWFLEENRLVVNWMSGEPAPMAMLELLSCQSKKRCQLPNCSSLSNALQCTDLCTLQECDNRQENPVEDITDTDDEDDEDDATIA